MAANIRSSGTIVNAFKGLLKGIFLKDSFTLCAGQTSLTEVPPHLGCVLMPLPCAMAEFFS